MATRPDGLEGDAEADGVADRVAVADEVPERVAGLVPVARAEPFTAAVG